jgi:AcrR family transcriptional regulator
MAVVTNNFHPIHRRERRSPEERRKQIAEEASKLIARYGSYGFSMQMLADAVKLTLPGLRHYVKNREELLALVIQMLYDDSVDSFFVHTPESGNEDEQEMLSLPQTMRAVVQRNTTRPQMVTVFMRLAIEAEDPQHPAHKFYRDRHKSIITDLMSHSWRVPECYQDPRRLRDLIVTAFFAMDGVQIQSMTNPDETMMELWNRADSILFPSPIWDRYR